MRNYKAIVIEKTSPELGKIFASTKSLAYKGMTKDEFYKAVEDNQCYTFEVVEF